MTKTKIAFFAIPALAAVLIGAMMLPVYSEEDTSSRMVTMDIKPGSCPNPLNTNTITEKEALVSVAILGEQKLADEVDVVCCGTRYGGARHEAKHVVHLARDIVRHECPLLGSGMGHRCH